MFSFTSNSTQATASNKVADSAQHNEVKRSKLIDKLCETRGTQIRSLKQYRGL